MSDCLFCRIARGELPCDRLLETEDFVAFRDINPQAPVHALIIPKRHIEGNNAVTEEDVGLIGRMFVTARDLTVQLGVAESGYRLVFNCNEDGQQTVFHLHLHLLGGRPMRWPPG